MLFQARTEQTTSAELRALSQGGHDATTGYPIGIVGASAAGLFTSLLLSRAGREVHVFERAERLAPTARTLIVTDRMQRLLGFSAEKCVVNKVNRFELFTDGRAATIPLNRPDLVIERSDLIRLLAEEAEESGVKLQFGRRFASLERGPESVGLSFEVTEPRARGRRYVRVGFDTVIGADGVQSRVAHAAGWPRFRTVPLVQAVVQLPSGIPPDSVRVWFIPDDTPYFYWLIPESRTRGVLGLIGAEGRQTRRCLERFMETHHFKPLVFQGARIPLYEGWIPIERKIGGGRVYLVGDAAAQVKVTTLGGVVTGFRGALAISERIVNGGQSRELYTLRRELDLHLLIRRSIHCFRQADYSRVVDWINEPMRRSLSLFSRDDVGRVLWHICCSQPLFFLKGLRGLLTSSLNSKRPNSV